MHRLRRWLAIASCLCALGALPSTMGWASEHPAAQASPGQMVRNQGLPLEEPRPTNPSIQATLAQTQRKELWLLAAAMGLGAVMAVLVTAARGLRCRAQWAAAQSQETQQALQMREASLQHLARSTHGMQLALQGAGLGTWDWDLRRDCLQLDPPALQVLGHSTATLPALNMARHVWRW